MNKTEYLLTKLSEECAEVIQRCTKAQTFGLNEKQPGQELSNITRLASELHDLFIILSIASNTDDLKEIAGFLDGSVDDQYSLRRAEKVKKYMSYSIDCGQLSMTKEELEKLFE